jgi:hypothetical protein
MCFRKALSWICQTSRLYGYVNICEMSYGLGGLSVLQSLVVSCSSWLECIADNEFKAPMVIERDGTYILCK